MVEIQYVQDLHILPPTEKLSSEKASELRLCLAVITFCLSADHSQAVANE